MANILQEGFPKLMRYAQNLAEYDKAIEEGIIDENVFVIVLDEKVAKFKGQTFDWSGGVDMSALVTKDELSEAEEVTAAALNDLEKRKADKDYVEEALGNVSVDTSAFATKEELDALSADVITNEEVTAAALNDLDERVTNLDDAKANQTDFDKLKEDAATKDEFTTETLTNEEIIAAAINDLNTRLIEVAARLDAAGL